MLIVPKTESRKSEGVSEREASFWEARSCELAKLPCPQTRQRIPGLGKGRWGSQSQVSDGFLRKVFYALHPGPTLQGAGKEAGYLGGLRAEGASALLPQGGVKTQERKWQIQTVGAWVSPQEFSLCVCTFFIAKDEWCAAERGPYLGNGVSKLINIHPSKECGLNTNLVQ